MKIIRKKNENSQSNSDNENDSEDKDNRSRSYATLGQLADQIHMKAKANMLAHGYEDDLMDYDDESVEGVCTVGEEHTGRWTREEHSLFLEGLKKFGKVSFVNSVFSSLFLDLFYIFIQEWKKVAAMVRTRTVVQTRTHAQKYFQKLSKGMGDEEYMEELELKSPSLKTKSIKKNSKPDLNLNKKNLIENNYEDDQESSHSNNNPKAEDQSSLMTPIQNNSISIIIPQSALENFPQPSPAACGKRKEAELAAAKILASTSSHEQDAEDAQLLSKIKEVAYRPGEIVRKRKLGLSIINPEEMEHGLTRVCEPSTPWESEVKALEEAIVPNVEKSIPLQMSTPYDQNDFIDELTEYIKRGDILEIKRSLSAIQGTVIIKTVSGVNNLTPMSPPTSLPTVFKFEPNSDQTGNPRLNTLDSSGENHPSLNFEGDSSSHQTTSSSDPTQMKFKVYENWNNKLSKILNKGENPKDTLLFIACSLSKEEFSQKTILEICRILIDHGSNPCLVDKNVGTCLHLVASQGIDSVGRLLLNRGCSANEIDGNGNTALHIAAKNHHTNFLELLVDFGANCHIRNFVGRAALNILDEMNENKSALSNENLVKRNELRRVLLSLEPRLRTLILYHEDCLEHIPRRSSDWEAPDRIKSIMRFINDSNNFQEHELEITSQFDKAPVELLSRVHSPEYITFVDTLSKQLQQSIGSDTFTASVPFTPQVQRFMQNQKTEETKSGEYSDTAFSTGTLNAARRAAGAVAHAVDRVLLGRNRNAFCVVRPPGHHAGYNGLLDGGRSCGFCIFNSVAAGAFHALEYHNCERVAIIDLDIHHG